MKTIGSLYACSGHWLLAAKGIFRPMWAYEISPYRRNISLNFKIPVSDQEKSLKVWGTPDVIAGSPPCSGICKANPNKYIEHPANEHMYNFAKQTNRFNPQVAIMEESNNLLKDYNKKILNKVIKIFKNNYDYVYSTYLNYGDILGIQDRRRSFIIASQIPLDVNKLVAPEKQKLTWKQLIKNTRPVTMEKFNRNRMPYVSHRHDDFHARIANNRERFFSVHGESQRDIVFRMPNKKYRFCSLEEIEVIMGMKGIKYAKNDIAWKGHTLGKGVPIRETAIILKRLRRQM